MKVFIIAALIAVASASSSYRPAQPSYQQPSYQRPAPSYTPHRSTYREPEYAPEPYQFEYAVNDHYSGANFAQNENSDGKTTSGYYQVALPDGRTQHVSYTADHYNGYQADVKYEGYPTYPEHRPTYSQPRYQQPHRQSYNAPRPTYSRSQPSYTPQRSYGQH